MDTSFDATCGSKSKRFATRQEAADAMTAARAAGVVAGKAVTYPCPYAPPGEMHFHYGHASPARLAHKARQRRDRSRHASRRRRHETPEAVDRRDYNTRRAVA